MELLDQLRELEQQLLDPAIRKNTVEVASLLSADFREFGASGRVWSRAEILKELATEPAAQLEATDFQLLELTPTTALLTYQSTRTLSGEQPRHSLRSSLWRLEDEQWRMLFHQGTLIP